MDQKCTAVVVAAGSGKRMGSSVPKQFLKIGDYPVLYYSLKCLEDSALIQHVILVVSEDSISYCQEEIIEKYQLKKVIRIVPGGKERYDSVYTGLKACEPCDIVLIHDGARPFLTEEILARGLENVRETGACVVAVPVKDTIKLSDDQGFVRDTPDRRQVWTVQTPQIFFYDLILKAYQSLEKKEKTGITDDAMVVEQETGVKVKLSVGSYQNIKITTPEDLKIAELFLKQFQ